MARSCNTARMTKPADKLKHPCFPQPEDGSTRIWRYLDLAKFVWLLEKQKLYLSRMDLLGDPHEGSTPQFLAELWDQQSLSFFLSHELNQLLQGNDKDEGIKKLSDRVQSVTQLNLHRREVAQKNRRWMYVNCWHLGNSESEAMWRLYCPNNNGVAIQTTYSKLVESVGDDPELHIGKVTYIDYEKQGFPPGNMFYPAMHKRISFMHESEVRLVKMQTPENFGTSQEFSPPGISVEWPIEPTVDAIYVNPYAPEFFHDVVCSLVQRAFPDLINRVHWSKMRAEPVYYT